jgi:hypothetical protein
LITLCFTYICRTHITLCRTSLTTHEFRSFRLLFLFFCFFVLHSYSIVLFFSFIQLFHFFVTLCCAFWDWGFTWRWSTLAGEPSKKKTEIETVACKWSGVKKIRKCCRLLVLASPSLLEQQLRSHTCKWNKAKSTKAQKQNTSYDVSFEKNEKPKVTMIRLY